MSWLRAKTFAGLSACPVLQACNAINLQHTDTHIATHFGTDRFKNELASRENIRGIINVEKAAYKHWMVESTKVCCIVVCGIVLRCKHQMVESTKVCCSVLQCVAVCCGVLQCVAVFCSVLQCPVCHWMVGTTKVWSSELQ